MKTLTELERLRADLARWRELAALLIQWLDALEVEFAERDAPNFWRRIDNLLMQLGLDTKGEWWRAELAKREGEET